jgi:UDP-N-acetylmuramoyl-tripeptide--D-alanyl-D-alanine ligase
VPNTLFELKEDHEAAVIEMGMSGLGEIHDLTVAVRPCVGVITTVGVSHLEHLGTRENILKAKLEIIDGMPDGAPLLICGDNDLLSTVKSDKVRIIKFGVTNPECDIRAEEIQERDGETFFTILSPWGEFSAKIPILGRHNVVDALAAFGVGCEMGVEPENAAMALANYLPTGMRQNVVIKNGVTVTSFGRQRARCYRALAELNGNLCIIDSANMIYFDGFMDELRRLGVTNAVYLDMGAGWNYSWYRNASEKVITLFGLPVPWSHNWVVFRK